eukprot:gnl/MRDRNA2_/MRDRNA2_57658_c0_seq1.p1 gnl/MRDRNA2_/MRDRNA2_57658_c0~~gnl/MRDRNA2_/MRDRNA2_57658_c0_seq1.p1  ORF type:complete len:1435 (-),score=257.56 gnl/MRDRNA2_/MRDRNA2_57658_c0_seq1:183-3860(-)
MPPPSQRQEADGGNDDSSTGWKEKVRRLFDMSRLIPQVETSTTGGLGPTENILSTTPRQSTNFGWNWDLVLHENNNFPRFNHSFPGGKGYLLLLNPHVQMHAGIFMNFTSEFVDLRHAPHVRFQVGLDGTAELGGRAVALLRFDDTVSGDPLNRFEIPLLKELSNTLWGKEIAFAVGNVPVSFAPGIKFNARAYHIGKFKGSIQMGVQAHAYVRPLLRYDTKVGADAMMNAEVSNLRVIPPTWSVFADHFEMGLILEPQLWIKGSVGNGKNMTAGFGIKPYMNVSITRAKEAVQGAGWSSDSKKLIVYPYRVSGLGDSGLFSVGVGAGGAQRQSSLQLNQGKIMEFHDRVQRFDFGDVSRDALTSQPIVVSITRQGQATPLAEVQVRCTQIVGDRCAESPLNAKLLIGSDEVTVELALEWQDHPIPWFVSRVRGLSVAFPKVELSPSFASEVESMSAPLQLQILRAGRIYTLDVEKDEVNGQYRTTSVLELGLTFLPSWHDWPGEAPSIALFLGGTIIAKGVIPEIPWSQTQESGLGMGSFHSADGATGTLDVDLSLHAADGNTNGAVMKMEVTVEDPSRSSFFLFPFEASAVPLGASKAVVWTARGTEAGGVNFELDALVMADNGVMQAVPGSSTTITQQCTEKASPDAAAAGYANLGTYCHLLSFTQDKFSLAQKVVIRLRWTIFGKKHEMLSSPVVMAFASEQLYSVLAPLDHDEFSADNPSHPLQVAWAKRVDHAAEDVRSAQEEELGIAQEIQSLYALDSTSSTSHGQTPMLTSDDIAPSARHAETAAEDMLDVSVVPLGSNNSEAIYHKSGVPASNLWLTIPKSEMASWPPGDYQVRLTWQEESSLYSAQLGAAKTAHSATTVIHLARNSLESSAPVESSSSQVTRKLQDAAALSWSSGTIDWNQKMKAFNPNCDKHPLKYGFGAGVFVKGVVRNIKLPKEVPILGGVASGANFDTGYKAVSNVKVGHKVSGVLNGNFCDAGACEGVLPGCPPPKVDAEKVPHVSFVFNRAMHWHKGTYLALREFIAYMLATLPEAVTLIAKQHGQANSLTKDAGNTYSVGLDGLDNGRRLTPTDSDWGKNWAKEVSFQAAVPFEIDAVTILSLLQNGALAIDSLDDGFVKERGSLAVANFGVNGLMWEQLPPSNLKDFRSSLANGPSMLVALLIATLSASMVAYGLHSFKNRCFGKRSGHRRGSEHDEERCQLNFPECHGDEAEDESE